MNVNAGRPTGEHVPPETVRLIEERNRLDAELHRFAKERLDAEVARRGASFLRRVERFRLMNATLGGIAIRR